MRPTDGREKREVARIGIINTYGGLWTDETFETPEAALAYLREYWGPSRKDLKPFKLAQVIKTVEVYRPLGEPTFIPLPV